MSLASAHYPPKAVLFLLILAVADFFCIGLGAQNSPGTAYDALPGELLLALGNQARTEGRFAEGIQMLETALNSPYGQAQFEKILKETLVSLNKEAQDFAKKNLSSYIDTASTKIFLEVTLNESVKERQGQLRKYAIEVRTFTVKPLPTKLRLNLYRDIQSSLKRIMDQKFPGNMLEYSNHQGRYYMEGFCNTEYPRIIPLAHYELGLLYRDYQDYVLAEYHLKQAIDNRQYFNSSEMVYAAMYALSDMYLFTGKLNLMKSLLQQIVKEHDVYLDSLGEQELKKRIAEVFMSQSKGFDRVLQTYRLPDDYARKAYQLLGEFYLESQDYEEAFVNLLMASFQIVSTLISELRLTEQYYQYESLSDLLNQVSQEKAYMDYLEESELLETLLRLGLAAQGCHYDTSANKLFASLAKLDSNSEVVAVAKRMISK